MKLSNALLCVQCETVFPATGACLCPDCGSGVSYPLARALERPVAAPQTAIPARRGPARIQGHRRTK